MGPKEKRTKCFDTCRQCWWGSYNRGCGLTIGDYILNTNRCKTCSHTDTITINAENEKTVCRCCLIKSGSPCPYFEEVTKTGKKVWSDPEVEIRVST